MNKKKHQNGFGLLDSLMALLVIGVAVNTFLITEKNYQENLAAKSLAKDNLYYAKMFGIYLRQFESGDAVFNEKGGYNVILPDDLKADVTHNTWNNATINYGTPCVVTIPSSANTEAIMILTVPQNQVNVYSATFMSKVADFIGAEGAFVDNSNGLNIFGNAGWKLGPGDQFTNHLKECEKNGNVIPKYSIAIDLNANLNFDQTLNKKPNIQRVTDNILKSNKIVQGYLKQLHQPGHFLNVNTPRTDINFDRNIGVVLNNQNPQNKVRLSVVDYGDTTGSPMIGLGTPGNNTNVDLVADTIKPTQMGRAGQPCQASEIGKTIVDAGSADPNLASKMSRGLLVCTKNQIICGTSNSYCYLPQIPNTVTFQAKDPSIGLPDVNGCYSNDKNAQGQACSYSGILKCPAATPFAISYVPGSDGKYVKYIVGWADGNNQVIGSVSSNFSQIYPVNLGGSCPRTWARVILYSANSATATIGMCKNGSHWGTVPFYFNVNQNNFNVDYVGGNSRRIDTPGVANPQVIYGTLNGFQVPIGYDVSNHNPGVVDCHQACNANMKNYNDYATTIYQCSSDGGQCVQSSYMPNFKQAYNPTQNLGMCLCGGGGDQSTGLAGFSVIYWQPSLGNAVINSMTCSNISPFSTSY